MTSYNRPYLWLRRHLVICFLLMTASFVAFGVITVDLVRLFSANIDLFIDYGWMLVNDGALLQFIELSVKSVCAIALFIVFKICESALLHAATQPSNAAGSGQSIKRPDEAHS